MDCIQGSLQNYLYLNAINEIIMNNCEALQMEVETLADLLLQQATNPEESSKAIVAESLG